MGTEFVYDVFLSHNSQDKPRVRPLAEKLRAAGLRVWFDEWSIAPGESIPLAIEHGLEQSRTLVLFLSPAALGSNWVSLERSTALFRDPTNTQRRFLPVLLEDCTLPDILRSFRYLDLREESDEAVATLVAAIKRETPPPKAPALRSPTRQPRRPSGGGATRKKAQPFALLALGSFLASLVLLWLLLSRAGLLVGLGLEGKLYYLVLLPLGLAVATALFGGLRSYARYRGRVLGGVLELGGPVVVFCLVVLGGFVLVPSPEPFGVTVFVHGEDGIQDLPLKDRGKVVLDLGPDRREQPIGAKGEAHFPGIPAQFRGQEVSAWVEQDGFGVADPSAKVKLRAGSVYLPVKPLDVEVRGRVQDVDGQPIVEARVRVREVEAVTNGHGEFVLVIPGRLAEEDLQIGVKADGFGAWNERLVPRSNDVVAVLEKSSE